VNDDSVRLGYNASLKKRSNSPNDIYMFTALPIRRPLRPLGIEYVAAAGEIIQKFEDREPHIFYSGGIDSEAVLEAFYRTGESVTAVMIRFNDGLNAHELRYASAYLKARPKIKPIVIDFNMTDWLGSNECLDYAREAQSCELGYTHLFKVIAEQFRDKLVLLGFDEPMCWADDSDPIVRKWIFHRHERHYSMEKFMSSQKIMGVPAFTQWSTELLNAYLSNEHWTTLFSNLYNRSIWNTEHVKYGLWWSHFGLGQRAKYHSFEKMIEKILDTDRDWKASLETKWDRHCDTEVIAWLSSCKAIK